MNIRKQRFPFLRSLGMITFGGVLAGAGLIAAPAWGQDAFDLTGADASAEMEYLGPPPMSGHEDGARSSEEEEDGQVEVEAEAGEWFDGEPWWTWSRASGDWDGLRPRLEEAGFTLEGTWIFEWSDVSSGGILGRSSSRSLLDFNLTLDLETLLDWQSASLFVDFYHTDGNSISADAGDFQGLSNIEVGPNVTEVAELWYEQWMMNDVLRLKVGKVEANSEFAFVDAAGEFINSSAGFSPTIFALPTYPDPAMSVNLFYYPTEMSYIGFGFYDGAATVDGVATGRRGPSTFFSGSLSSDYFLIGEFGLSWDEVKEWGPGRLAVGGWHHTGDHPRFAGGIDSGTEGFYALAEQQVWSPDAQSEGGLWAFAQYGFADSAVSAAEHHLAGGVFLQGTFDGREDDSTGFYVSHVILSDEVGSGFTEDETALELFYRFQLTPFFSLKPDLQFITNPGGVNGVSDATVFTLRGEITF